MPGFSQKPYDPLTQNDTQSPAVFQPPPPTRRPPPVPLQQPGMTISSFSQRPMEIPTTAEVTSPASSQVSSGRNNSEPMQGRNDSVAQSSAGTNGSNEIGGKSPSIFAAIMGRAPRMTKSRSCDIVSVSLACLLKEVQMESNRRNAGPKPTPSRL